MEACSICKKRLAEFVCDMPKFRAIVRHRETTTPYTITCDRHICKQCALTNGNGVHICKKCAKDLKEGFKWKSTE